MDQAHHTMGQTTIIRHEINWQVGEDIMNSPSNYFHPLSRPEWRKWLAENHTRTDGVWLITFKKAAGKPRREYDDDEQSG